MIIQLRFFFSTDFLSFEDDVRYTLDLMDFYGKTDARIVYVSTHGAVMAIMAEMQNSKDKIHVN